MQELEVLFMLQNAANVADQLDQYGSSVFGWTWDSDRSPSAMQGAGIVRERARVARAALLDFLIGLEVWGEPDHRELAVNIRKALDVARKTRNATNDAELTEPAA